MLLPSIIVLPLTGAAGKNIAHGKFVLESENQSPARSRLGSEVVPVVVLASMLGATSMSRAERSRVRPATARRSSRHMYSVRADPLRDTTTCFQANCTADTNECEHAIYDSDILHMRGNLRSSRASESLPASSYVKHTEITR